jgi:carboxylesterase type B
MVSHMIDEGPAFTPPNVRTDDELQAYIRTNYPSVSESTATYIVKTLYPAKYDGSMPYRNPVERTILMVTESAFSCNTNFLNKAFGNQTYAYEFQVPPGFHGYDLPSTFYNNQGTNLTAGVIAPLAEALQGYLTNFAMTGNPNGPGLPFFPMQGKNASMNALNATYIRPERDDTANARCAWWQKGLEG